MRNLFHSRRGQTLVEALVALSILTTGFIGIVTLLTKSFQLNRTTSYDTQGTYLAAEGIELAKNLIDHDVYYGMWSGVGDGDWGCSFNLAVGSHADYALDYSTVPPDCPAVLAPKPLSWLQSHHLYFNPSTTFYTYNGFAPAVPTDFTRDVRITNDGNDFDVQSTVVWTVDGASNQITLEDHFYNWQP